MGIKRLTIKDGLTSLNPSSVSGLLAGLGMWARVVPLLAVAGCAAMGGISKDSTPEAKAAVVSERSQARWDALIKGDVDKAYTYLSDGSKAATSLSAYKSRTRVGLWREAKVEKVECKEELCTVTLEITYDARVPRVGEMKGIKTPVSESWIIEDGSAGYVYR